MHADRIDPYGVLSRRNFVRSAIAIGGAAATGCLDNAVSPLPIAFGGRLNAAHSTPSAIGPTGLQPLGLASGRDGLLYVPAGHTVAEPLPLIVLLHGSGGAAANWFGSYDERAEAAQVIMLAIDSRYPTWDWFLIGYEADVVFIDQALTSTFGRCAVDPNRMAIMGFSDGASYALGIGLSNGDRFGHTVAYSPGGMAGIGRNGSSRVLITHGQQDTVLHVDITRRSIVPSLRAARFDVTYHEFQGGHSVPAEISTFALNWLKTGWA